MKPFSAFRAVNSVVEEIIKASVIYVRNTVVKLPNCTDLSHPSVC